MSQHEESEELLNSRMQRLSSRFHRFCMRYNLPRVHGCVWDRHCRYWGAPRRISLFWWRFDVWVDLPGYDKEQTFYNSRDLTDIAEHIPAKWQLRPYFGHHFHTKEHLAELKKAI